MNLGDRRGEKEGAVSLPSGLETEVEPLIDAVANARDVQQCGEERRPEGRAGARIAQLRGQGHAERGPHSCVTGDPVSGQAPVTSSAARDPF